MKEGTWSALLATKPRRSVREDLRINYMLEGNLIKPGESEEAEEETARGRLAEQQPDRTRCKTLSIPPTTAKKKGIRIWGVLIRIVGIPKRETDGDFRELIGLHLRYASGNGPKKLIFLTTTEKST